MHWSSLLYFLFAGCGADGTRDHVRLPWASGGRAVFSGAAGWHPLQFHHSDRHALPVRVWCWLACYWSVKMRAGETHKTAMLAWWALCFRHGSSFSLKFSWKRIQGTSQSDRCSCRIFYHGVAFLRDLWIGTAYSCMLLEDMIQQCWVHWFNSLFPGRCLCMNTLCIWITETDMIPVEDVHVHDTATCYHSMFAYIPFISLQLWFALWVPSFISMMLQADRLGGFNSRHSTKEAMHPYQIAIWCRQHSLFHMLVKASADAFDRDQQTHPIGLCSLHFRVCFKSGHGFCKDSFVK